MKVSLFFLLLFVSKRGELKVGIGTASSGVRDLVTVFELQAAELFDQEPHHMCIDRQRVEGGGRESGTR